MVPIDACAILEDNEYVELLQATDDEERLLLSGVACGEESEKADNVLGAIGMERLLAVDGVVDRVIPSWVAAKSAEVVLAAGGTYVVKVKTSVTVTTLRLSTMACAIWPASIAETRDVLNMMVS